MGLRRKLKARKEQVEAVLDDCRMSGCGGLDWTFDVRATPGEGVWFTVKFWAGDTRKGDDLSKQGLVEQEGREWRIADWMGENEIVKTALAAVMAAVTHEVLEHFLYMGEPAFHPHRDVFNLWATAKDDWV